MLATAPGNSHAAALGTAHLRHVVPGWRARRRCTFWVAPVEWALDLQHARARARQHARADARFCRRAAAACTVALSRSHFIQLQCPPRRLGLHGHSCYSAPLLLSLQNMVEPCHLLLLTHCESHAD